jgi:thiol-disulfide isomerase/thioredoxin
MRLLLIVLCFSYISEGALAQDVKVYQTFDEFRTVLEQDDGKVHVVNFWATWCAPCIAELPYFEKLNEKYSDEEVVFTLVSLDFGTLLESRVKPFIRKRDLQSNIVLLDDPKSNAWIDRVNPDWSGAIPATIVYRGKESAFYEQEFHSEEELEEIIIPFLK